MSSVVSASSSAELRPAAAVRAADAQQQAAPAPAAAARRSRLSKRARIALGVLLVALSVGAYAWFTRGIESTDNAQVDADLVAVPARIAGVVSGVHFVENQRVERGALLAEIDDAPARAEVSEAEANLAAARAAQAAALAETELVETSAVGSRDVAAANLRVSSVGARATSDEIRQGEAEVQTAKARLAQAETDLARAEQLLAAGAGTRLQRDQARTARDVAESTLEAQVARLSALKLAEAQSHSRIAEASAQLRKSDNVSTLVEQAKARLSAAEAQVDKAEAELDLARIRLSYTKIYAPESGVVSRKNINVGQAIAVGQPIVQLVPDARWVTANFKETQLTDIRKGQLAKFEVDAYPGVELTGEVESISGATGSRFALLPPDNATGNFTKVVQRVPVRIRVRHVPEGVTLRPGMSVELKVYTHEAG